MLEKLGLECFEVADASSCKCKCNAPKSIFYAIRKKTLKPEKAPDPFTSDYAEKIYENYDIHGFRYEENSKKHVGGWACVPQYYAPGRGGLSLYGYEDPSRYNDWKYPDLWKDFKPLCCCKKEAQTGKGT